MTNLQRLQLEVRGINLSQEELTVYLMEADLTPHTEYNPSSATNKRNIYRAALSILESIANNPSTMKNYKEDDMSVSDFGELKIMKVSLSFYLEKQAENIRMRPELGGGSLYDVGCYCIHSIRNVLNTEPNRVFVSPKRDSEGRVDMSVVGIMELDNGMTAVFDAAMDRTRIDYYEIIGTKGSIRVPRAFVPQMFGGEAQVIVNTKDGVHREEKVLGHQYTLEVEYFSKCILENEMPSYMMENTIQNMKVIEACFKSIEKEKFVNVSLIND
ncbi:Gfo/Idh/MocA family protein [Bacillus sp. SA1-12]|uniref:Gfo/Idh/MocA family protein n=1 Tax=Bacillus sp. SA1-12 TaxID=1455638 RepID=UPI00069731B1|nr:Gfo/Idh/MocA family oxidoreductase [Bacillus sp. SA1-12]